MAWNGLGEEDKEGDWEEWAKVFRFFLGFMVWSESKKGMRDKRKLKRIIHRCQHQRAFYWTSTTQCLYAHVSLIAFRLLYWIHFPAVALYSFSIISISITERSWSSSINSIICFLTVRRKLESFDTRVARATCSAPLAEYSSLVRVE